MITRYWVLWHPKNKTYIVRIPGEGQPRYGPGADVGCAKSFCDEEAAHQWNTAYATGWSAAGFIPVRVTRTTTYTHEGRRGR